MTGLWINTRRRQQQFARIDKILILRIPFKTMPFFARFKAEETTLLRDGCSQMFLPRLARHHGWNKRFDHLAAGDNGFACFDALHHTFRPQAAATLPFMDLRIHIKCSK
ncbi:hypothetical protein D3C75_1149160 [compost metagenome]